MWVRAGAASSNLKETAVPTWLRADSGTNLIKQGAGCNRSIVWLGSSVVECSHGKRETMMFESRSSAPVTFGVPVLGLRAAT